MSNSDLEKATFGAGCFWCIEAVFQQLEGVQSVVPGYAGGSIDNPSYRQVCSGKTGHAEVARITYNPAVISYETLLQVFWHTHNPTTKNRQGADVGTQYRSVIFYHSKEQKQQTETSLQAIDHSDLWEDSIVTEVEKLSNFSVAEQDHHDYYKNNPNAGYCSMVIAPKLKKLRTNFPELLED